MRCHYPWVMWLTPANKLFLRLGYWEVLLALVSPQSKHVVISQGPYKSQGHITHKNCAILGIYDTKKLNLGLVVLNFRDILS